MSARFNTVARVTRVNPWLCASFASFFTSAFARLLTSVVTRSVTLSPAVICSATVTAPSAKSSPTLARQTHDRQTAVDWVADIWQTYGSQLEKGEVHMANRTAAATRKTRTPRKTATRRKATAKRATSTQKPGGRWGVEVFELDEQRRRELRAAEVGKDAVRRDEDGRYVHLPLDPTAVRLAATTDILKLITRKSKGEDDGFALPIEARNAFLFGIPAEYAYARLVLLGYGAAGLSAVTGESYSVSVGRVAQLAAGATSPTWDNMYTSEAV